MDMSQQCAAGCLPSQSMILPTSGLLNEWFSGKVVPDNKKQGLRASVLYDEYSVYVQYSDS